MLPLLVSRLAPLDAPLPGVLEILRDFVVYVLVEEVLFYYSHR